MIKEYVTVKSNLIDIINEIESFTLRMKMFNDKHDNIYNYNINIEEIIDESKKWKVTLRLNKNEKEPYNISET